MSRESLCAVTMIALALTAGVRAELQVNTHAQHDQIEPAVAMSDAGDFVVVWRSRVGDGRDGGVFARRFAADGTPLTNEFKVNAGPVCAGHWTPAVATSSSGDMIILWVAAANGCPDIAARMFDADGMPLSEEWMVSPSPEAVQSMPSVAMNADGAFVVVWTNWYGQSYIGRTFAAGRVFDAQGVPVSDEFEIASHAQAVGPDVAMDEAGRFIVTWLRVGDTYNRPYGEYVMARQYKADGTPCAEPIRLTDSLNSRWYTPAIAAGLDGRFVITWAIGPFPYDIIAQSFDTACGPMNEPVLINTVMEGDQGHPCVTTNGRGDYLIVWDSHESDGSSCSCVAGQFVKQDGTLRGGELMFSTPNGRLNWCPDVAMAPDGRYVVVWVGQGPNGSGYDVFAQTGSL